eukprot:CAMPEP_0183444006 /NCGR_PEP_ID=MMETSP0370-20130417/93682_1 /TAXON_ID=268820 /ORGANISM="Peridinium aciculiferum, Strain PAER-2" /LENGTH=80 /DNA_ID=CAMNT_0025634211 /DNA_START=52 /DNA_END=291 /DNA_ORIENTATION=+
MAAPTANIGFRFGFSLAVEPAHIARCPHICSNLIYLVAMPPVASRSESQMGIGGVWVFFHTVQVYKDEGRTEVGSSVTGQ